MNRHRRFLVSLLFITTWLPALVHAHETRPALLEIEELQPGVYAVTWTLPVKDGATPDIRPRFPENCTVESTPQLRQFVDALVSTAVVECPHAGILGQQIVIEGLENTILETFVSFKGLDLSTLTLLLSPKQTSAIVMPDGRSALDADGFFKLGVEHIVDGLDHLLFLLGLLIIVPRGRPLMIAITGFTMAHGTTLIAATLGLVPQPGNIIEVVIALSVLIIAVEAVHARAGRSSLTVQYPLVVVLVFGLVHGFGFAGALAEIGLPKTDWLLALVNFNLGVEFGQLIFVGLGLLFFKTISIFARSWLSKIQLAVIYAIGSISAYWVIGRALDMFAFSNT